MRLSELVSQMGLWIFPVVGLLGFVTAFAIVFVRTMRKSDDEIAAGGMLPLEDGTLPSAEGGRR
ncbi:MAG: hypothetical protein AAFR38_10335 [Planctomycetota bacterium]